MNGGTFVYLLAGSLLVGSAVAAMMEKCPQERPSMVDVAAAVAVWPVFVVAGLRLPSGFQSLEHACKGRAA
jgi:hypothetical protein